MKNKIIYLILSVLAGIALVLTSCGTKTTPTTAETSQTTKATTVATTTSPSKPTTTSTTTAGNWWDKFGEPQYGGTITIVDIADPTHFDPYFGMTMAPMWLENLGTVDWKVDRKIWPFNTKYVSSEYWRGLLAESWETPDLQTIIFHIRKGINWQNKTPVNGRELTAYDIEYGWHRQLGLGSGFTKRTPYQPSAAHDPIVSVTATDKYTVMFKWKTPSIDMADTLLDITGSNSVHVAPEAIKLYGDVEDWRHAVGTGPFILDDYVSSSSLSYSKNPSYWGYDERYPENKIPYVDNVKVLIISNTATSLAAMRTGKIDLLRDITWQQAGSLVKTNPKIVQSTRPYRGWDLDIRTDRSPFTDIRVRKAMQMAIDLKTIAETYYGGTVDSTPYGLVGPALPGYFTPFNEWPKDVQEGYLYNPAGAKKLLSEAGYPNGFKTNVVVSSTYDLDLLQIAKAYLLDINIDMEIKVMDSVSYSAFTKAGKQDQLCSGAGSTGMETPPNICIKRRYSKDFSNNSYNNDPVYDEFYLKYLASLDKSEQRRLIIEANDYAISKHWVTILIPTRNIFDVYQPWFDGFSGEAITVPGFYCARFWVDQNVKKANGN